MKGRAHFTNLKGSFQVLQFHVGRKAETIADIVASFARVGQIRSEDEALETQGLRPLDQLLGNCPVAVDVELEPPEAAGGGRRDLLQRAGGVCADNVTRVHRFGHFGRYWKIIRIKVISTVLPDTRYRITYCLQRPPELPFYVYLTKHSAPPVGKYAPGIKNGYIYHALL